MISILLTLGLLLLPTAAQPPSSPKITVMRTSSGQYDILVDGEVFFPGSKRNVTLHHHDDLKPQKTVLSSGSDPLGKHTRYDTTYASSGTTTTMVATARVYDQHIVFSQSFPTGATNTANGDRDTTLSTFPSFAVEDSHVTGERGYLQYTGDMVGSGYHVGKWGDDTSDITSGIKGTGPLVVFQKAMRLSVVFSPFSNAMAANQKFTHNQLGNILDYGIMGNVTSIPPGYEISTIVSFAEGGVNSAMMAWGDAMLSRSQKSRDAAWEKDFALQYLGYSTDNGAYYYYTTELNKNYEETMLDVAAEAQKQNIPYRYWLADSWWYYKGVQDGVKNWTAMESVFPHGMSYVYEQTGWLVQGHNRFWSMNTDYARQNGGNWTFILDKTSQYALPYDQEFWNYLMKSSRKWGLTTYEQDWLDVQFDKFLPLTNSATLGRTWLMQMGTAAANNGISIQYCMSHCRHMLASVEIPAVTQARASGDYAQSRYDQWSQLGTTAMFAYALGVAPSKDNYWSTSIQKGNKWGDSSTEQHSRLQAAVSTLTKGPVCPSDKIGLSDRALIMRSAMSDGTLLQPSRPATQLDMMFVNAAFGETAAAAATAEEELWFADTDVSGSRYGVLFAARLSKTYKVDVANDLGFNLAKFVAVETNTTSTLTSAEFGKLSLSANGVYDFVLYNLAERLSNGWAVLGECKEKWVGVSKARMQSVSVTDTDVSVIVRGAPGETVTLTFAPPKGTSTVEFSCKVGEDSTARFLMPSKQCF